MTNYEKSDRLYEIAIERRDLKDEVYDIEVENIHATKFYKEGKLSPQDFHSIINNNQRRAKDIYNKLNKLQEEWDTLLIDLS